MTSQQKIQNTSNTRLRQENCPSIQLPLGKQIDGQLQSLTLAKEPMAALMLQFCGQTTNEGGDISSSWQQKVYVANLV
jgi:hypothetical protein